MTRVFRDVLKYVHKNNEYGEGSLLNKSNFSTLFPFLYFDLTKQKMDIKDGTTKLTFKYELSGTTAAAYSIYAVCNRGFVLNGSSHVTCKDGVYNGSAPECLPKGKLLNKLYT